MYLFANRTTVDMIACKLA